MQNESKVAKITFSSLLQKLDFGTPQYDGESGLIEGEKAFQTSFPYHLEYQKRKTNKQTHKDHSFCPLLSPIYGGS